MHICGCLKWVDTNRIIKMNKRLYRKQERTGRAAVLDDTGYLKMGRGTKRGYLSLEDTG